MTFRTFVAAAFVLNLLLSNVCIMGTAFAAPSDEAGTAEMLSREVPMSFNVVTCTWVKTDDGWKPAADSPCASGHCLKKEKPDTRCVTASLHEVSAAPLPIVTFVPILGSATHPRPTAIAASPPPYPGLASTVLRT